MQDLEVIVVPSFNCFVFKNGKYFFDGGVYEKNRIIRFDIREGRCFGV